MPRRSPRSARARSTRPSVPTTIPRTSPRTSPRSTAFPQQTAELADPGQVTLLAEHLGTIAGFAQLRTKRPPPCVTGDAPVEIARFYVDRAHHGTGLAQQLMAAARAAAIEMGGRTLWLGVWERNPRAIAYYAWL